MHDEQAAGAATIRTMDPDGFSAVRALAIAAFDGDPSIGVLLDALHDSWAWEDDLSFVAVLDGEIVGHVLYTHAFLDAPAGLVDVLVLGPIGVRPDLLRMGIGSALIRHSLAALEQRGVPLVFLEGHPGYYPRFGFERAGSLGFIAPSVRIPDDAFMVYRLAGWEEWMTGALVYADAFWRADAVGLRAPE
jgi:putative acetyltransferase